MLPILGVLLIYGTVIQLSVGLKPIHGVFFGLMGGLIFLPVTRRFLADFAPLVLFWVLYDSLKLIPINWRGTIRVQGPYQIEMALDGFRSGVAHIIPSHFFTQHHLAILDIITGTAYGLHVIVPFLVSLRWWFVDRARSISFNRLLLIANLCCFATYLAFPVTPPWYISHYGFATPDWSLPGEAAGLHHFDAIFGVEYFGPMYSGLNGYIFGAVPSGHALFPVLLLWSGWDRWRRARGLAVGYMLLIWFAAVYLNHHYVIDVILGVYYGSVVWCAKTVILPRLSGARRFATLMDDGTCRKAGFERVPLKPPPGTA